MDTEVRIRGLTNNKSEMSNTGYKYIHFNRSSKKFQVKIWAGDRNIYFKEWKTLEEAIKVREEKMKELGLTLYLDK